MSERASLIDARVVEAQKHNLGRMDDRKLSREWHLVTGFPERPPIREAYIDAMYDEFARRGLPQPQDVRRD